MTEELWDRYEDEFLKWERVDPKRSVRADLHAFLLLDEILPPNPCPGGGYSRMVAWARHDEIYLSVDCDRLAEVITDAQVLELTRCGVRYDENHDSLCMFV